MPITELELWLYPAFTALAMLTGFIDAIAGGGGLIMLPALIYAGIPPHTVLGTNKLQSMFGTGMALFNFRRAGLVAVRPNLWTVAVVFAGAVLGALTIQRVSADVLRLVRIAAGVNRRDNVGHARSHQRHFIVVGVADR